MSRIGRVIGLVAVPVALLVLAGCSEDSLDRRLVQVADLHALQPLDPGPTRKPSWCGSAKPSSSTRS